MLTFHVSNTPLGAAGTALNRCLQAVRGNDVLLLLSGGSALALAEHIDTTLLSPQVTITMLDERYTHDSSASNFAQLTALPWWERVLEAGVSTIDPRPLPVESLEDTAHRLNIAFKHWHITHHDGIVIATIGIGPDGHIAGVLPFPEDHELFASYFLSDHRCIRGYQVGAEKNPHTKRITTTLSYLKRHVAHAIVYVAGEEKRTALTALRGDASIAQVPARILTALPDVQIYTDLTLDY